ncbi:ferritin family protein [Lentimicrobium sp.]|jgi:rubrerythrin|uniref:rubrerythrin family protein n=1 Tax=Lentimicrobium sp. TaxID=2034841 RepID=UPI0025E75111|nr:ferritin family protein [Lentimicrobium sp.]MCO5255400.1 rubrerythrin family protein [Lentimicrobium sp.]MCO5261419.1 rubrerythrin family protein [Lentimicrobium sp.]HPF63259.1 ferritin family protein [Lentimicrobium sp.]HPJ61702.1 ferritin family protein [Lentimicrobium sp.]HPR24879.1 ferritin family protein [Lentimicrobium sp.]
METLRGSLTEKNLARAFLSESANIRKCEIFSKQAKREGFEQIAAIFLEVAEQKRSHTKTMYKFLEGSSLDIMIPFTNKGIGPTLECLREAALSELEESQNVFEEYERIAWEEGFKQIATKFKLFRRIKQFYSERFYTLADNIAEDKVFKREKKVKWICRKCGLIYESERALKNCPGCEHPQAYFEILSENY